MIIKEINRWHYLVNYWEESYDTMPKVFYCGLRVSEFEFYSRYYVHFQNNTLQKDIVIPPVMG